MELVWEILKDLDLERVMASTMDLSWVYSLSVALSGSVKALMMGFAKELELLVNLTVQVWVMQTALGLVKD